MRNIDVRNNLMTAETDVSGSTVPTGKWDNGIDDFYFSPQKTSTTAPTITSANSATVAAGGTFAVTATGTAPITCSLTGAPAGVSINPATGLITIATTSAAGTHTFTITATNGTPPDATQSFTLTVTAAVAPPSYNVSIGTFAGGSVTSNHATATAGATVALTVSPRHRLRIRRDKGVPHIVADHHRRAERIGTFAHVYDACLSRHR